MENKTALDNLVQSISAQDFKNIWYRLTNKTKDKKELLIKDRSEFLLIRIPAERSARSTVLLPRLMKTTVKLPN